MPGHDAVGPAGAFVTVYQPLHEAELALLCEIFDGEGVSYQFIPAGSWNEHMAGVLSQAHGIGELRVPERRAAQARALIREALPGNDLDHAE